MAVVSIMIKLLKPLPKEITIALSGGVDSMAVVDFLSYKHNVTCAFFDHCTPTSEKAFYFVEDFCYQRNLPLIVGASHAKKSKQQSWEEFWRIERYKFLDSLNTTVVTAHTLDDCVETYLFSALHGSAKTIPYKRNQIIRPFLTTRKYQLQDWCVSRAVSWIEDDTNSDLRYMRNYIRHELLEHALYVNPGLYKTVKKLVLKNLSP